MENSYSIQGYTIEGLSRLQNTRHEIAIEAKEKRARKTRKTGLENKNTKLNAEQIEWLKANFATTRRHELAKVLNVTSRTIGNYARRYNLVHALVIEMIGYWLGFNACSFNPLFTAPVLAVVVLVCSFLISIVIGKIPVLNKYIV